jgi:hypothetical protein
MLVLNQILAEFPFLDALICDLEHTWWRLFKKRAMCTKFDIYIFIYHDEHSHIRQHPR